MSLNNSIKIRLLVENKAMRADLGAEHGLSYFIEADGQKIVFDTGQSDLFALNARLLGIDLTQTDQLVLSHGHYDHTGGLWKLCELASTVKISGHPDLKLTRYSIKEPGKAKSIGIPSDSLECLNQHELEPTESPIAITPSLHVTGAIPRESDYEDVGGPFFLDPEGKQPDGLPDDQALWFVSDKGLVIILGCAHAGIINTINYCKELSGESHVHALIGGFHLVNASDDRLDKTVSALKEIAPDILAACHCTGDRAVERMNTEFPDTFSGCGAGSVFTFTG
jgi:7,8-dihydropterin-6-yl-methyl-4-(beta-D-ribofuranosyl)aminobenzene 5'-phosphate synthase